MDDKTRTEFILLFNQGFEEIVLPQIEDLREDMAKRFDKLEVRVNSLEVRVDSVDRKLDRSFDNAFYKIID